MNKRNRMGVLATVSIILVAIILYIIKKTEKKTTYKAYIIDSIKVRKRGLYEKYIKRGIDIICSIAAIVFFSPVYILVAILVRMKLGSPILFTQDRPGIIGEDGKESIFRIYKFRTMTDEKDEKGELLPDKDRLNSFGKWLRSTSLDELPEVFNILNGTLSICGPRPQLVRDVTFMTKEQRMRHTAKPGLTGLAQVNGRNAIKWEEKLDWDLKYIKNISFLDDLHIILKTIKTAIINNEGITDGNMATAEDLGDYLLKNGKVSEEEYNKNQSKAEKILNKESILEEIGKIDSRNHVPFSVIISVYKNDNAVFFSRALDSITESQTIIPNEIVLVVDGPISKEIEDVISEYTKKYGIFKVIRLKKNVGLGKALKLAIENSTYELIARMDSDDVSAPTRFEEQLAYFELNPEIDVLGGDITEFIGEEHNIVGKRAVPLSNDCIREFMKERCGMNHVSVMYKKEAVKQAGGYLDLFWNEDYYLWIRMWMKNAVFANTGSVLVNVRVGTDMYKRRGGSKYFKSEKKIQDYMLKYGMISYPLYIKNIAKRLVIQKLMPSNIRGFIFRKLAREKVL